MQTNNTITEIKNTLEGINSRISEAEEWISELEDKMVEITSEDQNKVKRIKRTEANHRERPLGQYQMHQYSNYRGPRRRREKKKIWEHFWRDYSWKFPQHEKDIVNQVQEAQRVPYRINPRRNTPRHILIKLTKTNTKKEY